jgi:hypothetical protein
MGQGESIKPVKRSSELWLGIVNLLFSLGILVAMIYYIVELEITKTSISVASNKPAGEFAIEPKTSVGKGVLNECTINGLKNQACIYSAATINEAIDQCNRFPQICNRFVYNSASKTVSFISLTGNDFITNINCSIATRQVGVTYSGDGPTNNTNSGGLASVASFTSDGSQAFSSGLTSQQSNNIAGGTVTGYY